MLINSSLFNPITHLEVHAPLLFVRTWCPQLPCFSQPRLLHTGLIRATQDELHGAQVLRLLRELAGGGENGAACVLRASSRARGCDLVLTWRSRGTNFGLSRELGAGLCAGAQAQGCVVRLLGRLDQLTGGGLAAPISVPNARSLALTPAFITRTAF